MPQNDRYKQTFLQSIMQPYPYITYPYPYPNGATMPVPYMAPPNYQQSSIVHPTQYVPQLLPYPPGYPVPRLPPPHMSTMIPIVPPPQLQKQFQHPQAYYYNHNGVNPAVPYNSKAPAAVPKKDTKENKEIKTLVLNNNTNDSLKHKSTRVKLSKIYRNSKNKPSFQDNDSSDDEYEQIPLDSARPQTFKYSTTQTKRSTAHTQRLPSAASNCSHCSACTNCSCTECRYQNKGHIYDDCPQCRQQNEEHIYDDCPQCRAEWEYQQAQIRRQKRK